MKLFSLDYKQLIEPMLGEVIFHSGQSSFPEINEFTLQLQLADQQHDAELIALLQTPDLAALRRYCAYLKLRNLYPQWEQQSHEHLLVYGTLKQGYKNFHALNLTGKMQLITETEVKGALYNLGSYPGLTEGSHDVAVELHKILDSSVMPLLDQLEGWHANDDHVYYRRECLQINAEEAGSIDAWIYLFNQTVTGYPLIPDHCWKE